MRGKYTGLYEEPTSYKYEYTDYSKKSQKKPASIKRILKLPEDDKSPIPIINTISANDSLKQLSYEKRLRFDALWEPKHSIYTGHIKPTYERRILGDARLDEVIKTRPRVYMTPSVSVDDVADLDKRKLMIDFTYQTLWSVACKETLMDFEPRHPCTAYTAMEKRAEMLSENKLKSDLPLGCPSIGRTWDKLNRRFLNTAAFQVETDERKKIRCTTDHLVTMDTKQKVYDLLQNDKVSIIYHKLPPAYGGHRTQIALGAPLEKKDIFMS